MFEHSVVLFVEGKQLCSLRVSYPWSCEMIPTSESVAEILKCDHLNESY